MIVFFLLPSVNNMAELVQTPIDLTVTNCPPSGRTDNVCKNGFQYRGKMFTRFGDSQSKTISSQTGHHTREINPDNNSLHGHLKTKHCNLARQIQSANGRLERQDKNENEYLWSDKSQTSIIDLNLTSDVPDHEEQLLLQASSLHGFKPSADFLTSVAVRPSSAKGSLGSLVVKVENDESPDPCKTIKPSVYGLKVGRQVFGCEPEILEAWKDIPKEFPYKLSEQNELSHSNQISQYERSLPSTCQPLLPWLQENVPPNVTGLDPSISCHVFLSHDYRESDLPEVPPPQDPSADLSYACVVETPRQPTVKKYKELTISKTSWDDGMKCSHSGVTKLPYSQDISNLSQRPYTRPPEKIRKEITELEDLMRGIGSLTSSCSFVQFQAEIAQAKDLASKLRRLTPRENNDEPVDTFGLLKIYKDHEIILAALQQRRLDCLNELARLERDL